MGEVLLLLVVALTVAAVVFGVTVLVSGRDPGLVPAEPDGRAVPLPGGRPLHEADVAEVRFDTALRGYRMAQVDQAMRRAAYDIGYKSELIGVLEAEVAALREGRAEEADALRRAREEAAGASPAAGTPAGNDPTADAAIDGLTAEAGVAEAPAAAAVEDEKSLPADLAHRPAPAGPEAPVAPLTTPVDATAGPELARQPGTDGTAAAGDPDARPATDAGEDPTGGPAGGTAGGGDRDPGDGGRTRGAVVRSESA
ncbi:DivIVA domain-containing protein [Micromonospora sp. MS34]|uniref:DivIVA domain-containing protein n=1 Tax=Micromonospora sp. MS34 TaxID=3385971 RepID=UPI00399FFF3F